MLETMARTITYGIAHTYDGLKAINVSYMTSKLESISYFHPFDNK